MLKITLNIKGEEKTFTPTFISGRVFRNTLKLAKIDVNKVDENMSDEFAKYICDVFGNKFTIDEFYDGIDAREILPTFLNCIKEITGQIEQKTPKNL